MADFAAPLIGYNFPALVNKELVDFTWEEDRQKRTLIVPDTVADSHIRWLLTGYSVRYRFSQVVRTVFTDPASYSDSDRTPPASLSAATAMAASISMISLPGAMGAAASSSDYPDLSNSIVSDWELTGHTMQIMEPGNYEVIFKLQANTSDEWDWKAFTKTKLPAEGDVGPASEEA